MPIVLNGSLPLPNIKVYTTISILLVSCSVYFAINVTSDPLWRQHNNITTNNVNPLLTAPSIGGGNGGADDKLDGLMPVKEINNLEEKILAATDDEIKQMIKNNFEAELNDQIIDSRGIGQHFKDVVSYMSQEPICIWTLINMAYCCLILLGKSIQKLVFGELRISEQQHMKDKFWNFIFYKFIFVFGVVNVQYMHEVILWVSWFSVLGFLHLLSQISKDRFEYLSFSPTTPGWSHFRLIALLSSILTISGFMLIISIGVGLFSGWNTFAFMAAECVLLSIRTLHVLIRYGMFLYDMRQGGISNEQISWDKRGPVAYYIELSFEVAALMVDFMHHLHMLIWSNIFLSMASLVIVMQLRYLTNEIQRKIKKHRNYLWVLNHMEKSYPLATAEDLSQNSDNCAICWEKMETARKLPCSHLFHNSCLQSWLEQDTSCPTCRLALSVNINSHPNPMQNEIRIDETETTGRTANNHFFHFNGSRYVSWLPNFSVEVTHINNVLRADAIPQATNHTSQLRNMARHVQEMFPRYPLSVLIADLQTSRSIEITIDNILEGRLQLPVRFSEFDDILDGEELTTTNSNSNTSTDNSPSEHQFGNAYPVVSASDYYLNADEFNPNLQYSISTSSSLSSSSNGYEVENRSSNLFGNYDTLLRDDSPEELPLGDRFSKSSEERERILQRRKEQLVVMARKKYLDKNRSDLNSPEREAGIRHRNKSSIEGLNSPSTSTSVNLMHNE